MPFRIPIPVIRYAAILSGVWLTASVAQGGVLNLHVSNISFSAQEVPLNGSADVKYTLSGAGFGIPGGLLDVRIDFLQNGDIVKSLVRYPGEQGAVAGANKVSLAESTLPPPGTYTVRVSARGISGTAAEYVNVASPADPNLQFFSPRGVDVNRIPGHPAFGRIYVTEGQGGSTSHRLTRDGVYTLHPDLTPAFAEPRATGSDLGSLGPWAGSNNSPFRISVGPDGLVYITDASDAHSGLFVADADLSSVNDLLAYPFPAGGARTSSGLVTDASGRGVYGSISSVWVEGSGADRTIFTTDEDLPPGNSLWSRQVPSGTTGSGVPPAVVSLPTGAFWIQDAAPNAQGSHYIVSTTQDDAALYDASGARLAVLPANSYENVPVGYHAVYADNARDTVFLATTHGRIFEANSAFTQSHTIIKDLGAEVRDIAVDAEGWIYAVNATDKRLHVFVPAGDFTILPGEAESTALLTVTHPRIPGDVAPVGPEGLHLGENGQRYGDGLVDLRDAALILRITTGLYPAP